MQVDVGTLAPIEIVRAEAEVATDEQALVTSETTVLQQETILKNALSRNGLSNPAVAAAHIVPTDHIQIPPVEKVEPIQDLFASALDNRPELQQSRIQLENQKIGLTGTRNLMLPDPERVRRPPQQRPLRRPEQSPQPGRYPALRRQSESILHRRLRQRAGAVVQPQFPELLGRRAA